MQKSLQIIFLIIASLLTSAPLFANDGREATAPFDSCAADGMKIKIRDAGLFYANTVKKPSVFYVSVDFINTSVHKKFDVSPTIELVLNDEFDNNYSRIASPDNYKPDYQNKNEHYPSLYPEEVFTQTFFFEPPLAVSSQLFLRFDGNPYELSENIVLHIFRDQYLPDDNKPLESVLKNGLRIKGLKKDISVVPGERYPVKVELSKEIKVKPKKLYVISPDYLYEDMSGNGIYQVKVPQHYPVGPFQILVIAEWSKEDNMPTLSDSLTLNIVDPQKKCQDSCPKIHL